MIGKIVIGTEINNDKLEQQFKKLEAKYDSKTIDIEIASKNVEEEEQKLQQIDEKIQEINNKINTSTEYNEKLYDELFKQYNLWDKQSLAIDQANLKLEKQENQLEDIQAEMEGIDAKQQKITLQQMKENVDKIGRGLKGVVRSAVRWGIAIFGIRSAYNMIRNAINTIAGNDAQLKADIDYMKNAIIYSLEPVVRKIVELAKQLLIYIGYIINAWTGKNIFENANKSLKNANKSAKALQKTLAGFDEMNIITDTSSGGGSAAPSFNLTTPEDADVPKWLKWIGKNGPLIVSTLTGIGTAIKLISMGLGIKASGIIGLIVAQIVAMVIGLTKHIPNLIKLFKDFTLDNFLEAIHSGIESMGLIGLLISNLIDLIFGSWDNFKNFLKNIITWIDKNFITPIKNILVGLWDKIVEIFTPVVEFFSSILSTVWENINIAVDNIKKIFSLLWEKIKEIFDPVAEFFKNIFTTAFNKIKSVFTPIVTFFGELWTKVKTKLVEFGTKVGETVSAAFKKVINAAIGAIESILNAPIKGINKLIGTLNKYLGTDLNNLSTFSLPRLAKGGIINMPGQGVPVGSAIAGERGQEAVLPLTDSQQMELLGETIGKYININATIPVYVGNRQVAREIRKIDAEDKFAYNGG